MYSGHDFFDHNADDENDNEEKKRIGEAIHSIKKVIPFILDIFFKIVHKSPSLHFVIVSFDSKISIKQNQNKIQFPLFHRD